jgi:predicted esterase
MAPPKPTTTHPLKILMLHGYTQSAPLFHSKTRALKKSLAKALPGTQLIYITAPHALVAADIPRWDQLQPYGTAATSLEQAREQAAVLDEEPDAWAWWRRKGEGEPYLFEGLDEAFKSLADVLVQQGPFDGVLGFSQGAAMAGMLASALETGRRESWARYAARMAKEDAAVEVLPYPAALVKADGEMVHPPLKFAVSYSGFAAVNKAYRAFIEPKMRTPMLHFIGSLDTVVEEKRSLSLVDACEVKKVVYHPGGHFVPASQREFVGALIAFIRDVLTDRAKKDEEEEKVEDMELPFSEGRL